MAAFAFDVAFYAFGSISTTGISNGQRINQTVRWPNDSTVQVDPGAPLTVIRVNDDDASDPPEFSDGFIDTTGDGSNPSTKNNDQLLAEAITIDGRTYPAGSQVELEFAINVVSDQSPPQTQPLWIIRIDGRNVGLSGPQLPEPGVTYTVQSSLDGQETPVSLIPCFVAGGMVETPLGPRAVETLVPGDTVLTRDSGTQTVRWVGLRPLTAAALVQEPRLRPIRFRAGSLGPSRPVRDTHLSPEHRVLVQDAGAGVLFGTPEMLVAARTFLGRAGVSAVVPAEGVTYVHLLFDRHEILTVDGLESESYHPSAPGRSAAAEAELTQLFPDLSTMSRRPLARPALRGVEGALLSAGAPRRARPTPRGPEFRASQPRLRR